MEMETVTLQRRGWKRKMKYDFENKTDRSVAGSSKWYFMKQSVPEIPDGIIPFSVADMELKNAPEILNGLKEFLDEDHINLGYTIPTAGFIEAVKGWMHRIHHWDVEPEWAALSPGVIPALYASVRCYTEPGDGVMIFSPIYYPFRNAIVAGGREVVDIPLRDVNCHYEIDWDAFEKAAQKKENKVLMFCSPHNPVGRVWTKEELTRLSEICLRNHVLVLSDEIHADLLMPGQRHTVYASLSEESAQNCVIYTAPSKTFNLAGMQTAVIFIPNKELHRKFTDQMDSVYLKTLTTLGFKACELAYTRCDEWYRQMLEHIDKNRKTAETYIAENIPEITVYPMEGTYLQWWDCRRLRMTPEELENFMKHEAFVVMDDGYIFGETGKGFERMNLACPTKDLLGALERIRHALDARTEFKKMVLEKRKS